MASPTDFSRRLRFIGQRIRESGASIQEEINREYRKIAVEALEHHKSLTPRQEPRPDKEPSATPLADGWRLVETGSIKSDTYSVAVVNVHDRPLTSKDGTVYRKENGQFFTVLDALDVGTRPHLITYDSDGGDGQEFYFWWANQGRYYRGRRGETVTKHPGIKDPKGVLRIPRSEAARKARNLRQRVQRRLRRL